MDFSPRAVIAIGHAQFRIMFLSRRDSRDVSLSRYFPSVQPDPLGAGALSFPYASLTSRFYVCVLGVLRQLVSCVGFPFPLVHAHVPHHPCACHSLPHSFRPFQFVAPEHAPGVEIFSWYLVPVMLGLFILLSLTFLLDFPSDFPSFRLFSLCLFFCPAPLFASLPPLLGRRSRFFLSSISLGSLFLPAWVGPVYRCSFLGFLAFLDAVFFWEIPSSNLACGRA